MRHFSTLIAAVLVAPLSWLLLAFGQDGSAQALASPTGEFHTGDLVWPALCLAAAGLLLGLLATPRFSPLGVALTGAGYAAGYLALLLDPAGVLGLFPRSLSVAGRTADPSTPLRTGTALLLGALLVVAMVGVTRSRRRPATVESPTPPKIAAPAPAPARAPAPAGPGPDLAAEPESVTRFFSTPRRFGNRRPNSYGPTDNGTDRWQATRTAWPHAQESRRSGQ